MVDNKTLAMIDEYNKGLDLYKQRKFKEAIKFFEKAIEIIPNDGPSLVYIERCKNFMENPPEPDWDGVYTFTTK